MSLRNTNDNWGGVMKIGYLVALQKR